VKIAAVSENRLFFFGPARGGDLEDESRSPSEDADEKALRERCGSGDVSAFEELYRTHGARMKSLAANLLGSRSDAEDAVQETFLKIYRGASSFRGAAKLSTWTYRILVNTCLDQRRRKGRNPDLAASGPEEPEGELRAPASDHPLRMDLEASLASLEEKHRTVFLLFEVEGFTHREVGEIVGVPEGKSRTLLFESKRELQRLLRRRGISGETRA
jgi:RNA polymerase sigma-70 factor, ECF subfamily